MEAETRLPQRGEGWRHSKTKNLYEIVGLGHHAETDEAVVVYQLYGWTLEQAPNLRVRPLSIFLGMTTGGQRFVFEREPVGKTE